MGSPGPLPRHPGHQLRRVVRDRAGRDGAARGGAAAPGRARRPRRSASTPGWPSCRRSASRSSSATRWWPLVGGAAMLPLALARRLGGRRPVAEVVVVGGGVGGLCAALRLGAAGHHVTLLERRVRARGQAGGRASGTASGSTPVLRSSRSRRSSTRCSASSGCGWPTTSTSCASTPRSATTGPTAATLDVADEPRDHAVAFDAVLAGRGSGLAGVRTAAASGSGRSPAGRSWPGRWTRPLPSCAGCAAERPVGHRRSPIARPGGPAHLRRPPAGAVGRPLRHLQRLVALRRAGHAGLHPPHRVGLRRLVPARGHGRAAGRSWRRGRLGPV